MKPDNARAPARLSYNVTDAIAATGLTRSRLYELIAAGELQSFRVGRRRMITARALEAFIARMERDATPGNAA